MCEHYPDKEGNHNEHLYRALWGGRDLRADGERGLARHGHTNLVEMQSKQGAAHLATL
jgi:hypothetical protein